MPPLESEERIFKPRTRKFLDFLLLLNGLLLLALVFMGLPTLLLTSLFLVFNCGLFLLWFLFILPVSKVVLNGNTLTGRAPNLSKVSISLRKINHVKTNIHFYGLKRKFFKDVWSNEGQRLRLQRRFLGEGQVNEIMILIEKYPFRESSPAA